MSTEKVINRWFVAVGNSVIQLVFGAIYALLIFTKVFFVGGRLLELEFRVWS